MNFTKLIENRCFFRSILKSIFFNFYYLPFKQAIRLPILLYKPHFKTLKGKIIINSKNIYLGMITLGKYRVSLYPNNGTMIENKGGKIVFNGKCHIGNNSYIVIGKIGSLTIGENFTATASLKIIVHDKINIGNTVLIGWNNLIQDTSFHRLKNMEGHFIKPETSPISIGNNNWITSNALYFRLQKLLITVQWALNQY